MSQESSTHGEAMTTSGQLLPSADLLHIVHTPFHISKKLVTSVTSEERILNQPMATLSKSASLTTTLHFPHLQRELGLEPPPWPPHDAS